MFYGGMPIPEPAGRMMGVAGRVKIVNLMSEMNGPEIVTCFKGSNVGLLSKVPGRGDSPN